jgi:DNA-binding NarL/FixJ family response regulator
MRTESVNTETPVIILSVLDDRASVERCMALKAHAFISKPINRQVVAGIVRAQLYDNNGTPYRPGDRKS